MKEKNKLFIVMLIKLKVLLLLILLSGCRVHSISGNIPGAMHKLALSIYSGTENIYLINEDGSGLQQITFASQSRNPRWSPDGSKIVFETDRDNSGYFEIYTMNADGTNPTRLTFNNPNNNQPCFSSDGERIVFRSDRYSSNLTVYIMEKDGSDIRQVTQISSPVVSPKWKPDNSGIIFARNSIIYSINSDGTNETLLFNSNISNQPDISRDGTKITFINNVYSAINNIFVMNSDGTNLRQLTYDASNNNSIPAFSPDGTKIAYLNSGEINIINIDGTNKHTITSTLGTVSSVSWRPQ